LEMLISLEIMGRDLVGQVTDEIPFLAVLQKWLVTSGCDSSVSWPVRFL